jgi:hypothetical protein
VSATAAAPTPSVTSLFMSGSTGPVADAVQPRA